MAMELSAVDYHRLSEETRDTVMAYAEQEWPITKVSVSSSACSKSWCKLRRHSPLATS